MQSREKVSLCRGIEGAEREDRVGLSTCFSLEINRLPRFSSVNNALIFEVFRVPVSYLQVRLIRLNSPSDSGI